MAGLIQEAELFGSDMPRIEGLREKARASFWLPTAKTEAWKYTKLHALKADDFVVAPSKFLEEMEGEAEEEHCCCGCHHEHNEECSCGHCHGDGEEHECSCCGSKEHLAFAAYELHFENGKFVPIYPATPRGVEIMTLMEALVTGEENHLLGKYIDYAKYPFAALNTAYLEEGVFIRICKGVKLDKPLALINHTQNGGENLLVNLRNLIVLEDGAKAELIEYYRYSGETKSRYFNNIVNEIYLGAGAELNHCRYQNEAFKAVHIALSSVRIKSNGIYNGFCLQKGADLGRSETQVRLLEKDAKAEVNAAYIMNGWATLDTTTDIEHLSSETYSSQLIKGVVGGEAKGVFQGKIHIAPDVQKTEGRQLHKALLLSDNAEIDVKPELEIFADDVKCSHGAACGELDKEQLFYMRSRGIGEEEAKQILIDAYLTDVIARIPDLTLREWLQHEI